MSPVITNVSGRPSRSVYSTVVSSVLGKQFAKSHASPAFGSAAVTPAMVPSTASLVNRRFSGGGRWDTGPSRRSPPGSLEPKASPAARAEPRLRKDLRDITSALLGRLGEGVKNEGGRE